MPYIGHWPEMFFFFCVGLSIGDFLRVDKKAIKLVFFFAYVYVLLDIVLLLWADLSIYFFVLHKTSIGLTLGGKTVPIEWIEIFW